MSKEHLKIENQEEIRLLVDKLSDMKKMEIF